MLEYEGGHQNVPEKLDKMSRTLWVTQMCMPITYAYNLDPLSFILFD